jgi:hypothetical protein
MPPFDIGDTTIRASSIKPRRSILRRREAADPTQVLRRALAFQRSSINPVLGFVCRDSVDGGCWAGASALHPDRL